jgi:flavin reductase (DIM6/NTAB) family NADH-FMN oxidoreductase RutF
MPSKRPRPPSRDQPDAPPFDEQPALRLIPHGVFVMTAAHDGRRLGLRVGFVQLAAIDPPSVSIALPKGQPISPLVRDAHSFGLCIIAEAERSLARRFAATDDDDEFGADPFDALACYTLETGSPLLERAAACLDCEVSMHIDCETDHELYIATVIASRVNEPIERSAGETKPTRRGGDAPANSSTKAKAKRPAKKPGAGRKK